MTKTIVSALVGISLWTASGFAQGITAPTGKETISVVRVGYAKQGEAVRKQVPGTTISQVVQKLNISTAKQGDSDVLLVFIRFGGSSLWIDKDCALVAGDGSKFAILAQGLVKSANTTGLVDTAGFFPGAVGFYADRISPGQAQVLAFRLPPTSGRFSLRGFKDLSSEVTIDLK